MVQPIHAPQGGSSGSPMQHTTPDMLRAAVVQPVTREAAPPALPAQAVSAPEGLERMLDQLNQSMQAWATGMRFDMDKDAQRVVVSIVEHDTGKVLRSIPSEAVLRVAKMITQMQGSAIDTRV